jgi:phosphopantothenoylcysteine synthetase/decarboxylase
MIEPGPLLITCGPTYEPIDEVRRLTNSSTGRLATLLAEGLSAAGWQVTLLRSTQTSYPPPAHAHIIPFTTRDSLKEALLAQSKAQDHLAVLHAAAVGDFEINGILDIDNQPVSAKKISGSTQELKLILKPAPKIIRHLRTWFPRAALVGWKYELEGKRPQALQKAWRQIVDCQTDASIANGTAYGDGFGFCTAPSSHLHLENEEALIRHLISWLPEACTLRQTAVSA